MASCPDCHSEAVKKNGHLPGGKRRLRCKACGRQFVLDAVWRKVSGQTKALIDRLLLERLSLAGIARATGVWCHWAKRYAGCHWWLATSGERHALSTDYRAQ